MWFHQSPVPHTQSQGQAQWKQEKVQDHQIQEEDRKTKTLCLSQVQDDCKESVHLTHSLHIQELRDLVKGSTKKKSINHHC